MTAQANAVALVGQDEDGAIRPLPVVPTAQKLALALPSLDELKVLEAYGKMFADSGLFPQVQSWQAAAAVIQYGSQLGIDAFTALKDIYWIKGKPSCDASLINSLIKRDHGGDALMPVEATKERCTIRFKRREWDHYEEATVTADDYKHLIDDKTRVTWQTNRQDMLWARNVSQIGRRHFSDTIKGLYTREEMVDALATEASYRVVPSPAEPTGTPGSESPAPSEPAPVAEGDEWERENAAIHAAAAEKFPAEADKHDAVHDLVCARVGVDSVKDAAAGQLRVIRLVVQKWTPDWSQKALEWVRTFAKATNETELTDIRTVLQEDGVKDGFLKAVFDRRWEAVTGRPVEIAA